MLEIHELDLIALREEHASWQKFIDVIPCAMSKFIFDKTFTLIRGNERFYQQSGYTKREFETTLNYQTSKIIHPDDLPVLIQQIQEQIKEKAQISVDYRIIKKDGTPEWCHLEANETDEFNGFPILDGVFTIITDAVTNSINATRYKQDADALLLSIPGGVAKRSSEPYGTYWDYSEGFFELMGYSNAEYTSMTADEQAKLIHPDDQDVLTEISRQILHRLPIDVEYRVVNKDGTIRRLSQTGNLISPEKGEPYYQCVFTGILDSRTAETALKTEKAKYEVLFQNIPCGVAQYSTSGKLLSFNDAFCEMTGYTREGIIKSGICEGYVLVFEEDRAILKEKSEKQLAENGAFSLTFRAIQSDGKLSWIQAKSHTIKDSEGNSIIEIVFTDVSSIQKLELRLAKSEGKLKQLIDTIPGGICDIKFNGTKIIPGSFSDGVYRLLGYTKEEYLQLPQRFSDGLRIAVESDIAAAVADLENQINTGIYISTAFRVKRKDESLLWIALLGRVISHDSGISTIQCIFTDISSIKSEKEEIISGNEGYSIISTLTDNILFEYDVVSDILNFFGNVKELFGIDNVIPDYKSNAVKSGLFNLEDVSAFYDLCGKIQNKEENYTQRIRLRHSDDTYVWYEIQCSSIFTNDGHVDKVIGRLANIDDEIKNLMLFPSDSNRDPLTGLNTNESSIELIKDYLSTNPSSNSLLMLINLNNFKIVNETYGSDAGDALLKNVAALLHTSFKNTDILGRVGGDEFIIFMKELPAAVTAADKEKQLLESLKVLHAGNNNDFPVNGSAGYAVYPQDGSTYEQLFEKADFSLYRAKRQEKTRA